MCVFTFIFHVFQLSLCDPHIIGKQVLWKNPFKIQTQCKCTDAVSQLVRPTFKNEYMQTDCVFNDKNGVEQTDHCSLMFTLTVLDKLKKQVWP